MCVLIPAFSILLFVTDKNNQLDLWLYFYFIQLTKHFVVEQFFNKFFQPFSIVVVAAAVFTLKLLFSKCFYLWNDKKPETETFSYFLMWLLKLAFHHVLWFKLNGFLSVGEKIVCDHNFKSSFFPLYLLAFIFLYEHHNNNRKNHNKILN